MGALRQAGFRASFDAFSYMTRPEKSLHIKPCKYENKEKKRPNPATFYSVEFKRKIVTEYLESDLTKREILDKYGIKANSAIQEWMRKFGITDPYAKKDYFGLPNTNRLKKKKPEALK